MATKCGLLWGGIMIISNDQKVAAGKSDSIIFGIQWWHLFSAVPSVDSFMTYLSALDQKAFEHAMAGSEAIVKAGFAG